MPKFCTSLLALAAFAALPLLAFAQTAGNTAPLGSKANPIKPASVTPTNQTGKNTSKGKRGSKSNPIAGSVHPRTSN